MIRRRSKNNGLPWRVYERFGKRIWRIWYQPPTGPRVTLFECMASDVTRAEARRRAKLRFDQKYGSAPEAPASSETLTVARMFELYFDWQDELPATDDEKKAPTTLDENRREAKTINKQLGDRIADELDAPDWFGYQDKRRKAGAGAKANKELALASAAYEWARLRGLVGANPARIRRVKTRPGQRRVMLTEVDIVLAVARKMGPGATIQALAARAALLCLRRPIEILRMRLPQIAADGIRFEAAKRKAGQATLATTIRWSPQLRATIREARAIVRPRIDLCPLVFGTLQGTVYTKSGWGASWRRLMSRVREERPDFVPFTLRDCRAGGVTAKRSRGDRDTQDATLHKDSRMIEQIYDRRAERQAKPAH